MAADFLFSPKVAAARNRREPRLATAARMEIVRHARTSASALEAKVTELEVARVWDAGDKGCGEIAMELRLVLQSMEPRAVLKLTARDAGAPEDVPAWCRMTRHTLLRAHHPDYWIQRREE